ncbi:MAG: TetR/AcrR family transcriptional regulator [Dehalococcoidia bacterium]|jgi:TetR/AcrR family transcriptional regulator, cholesterol catabolism regulator
MVDKREKLPTKKPAPALSVKRIAKIAASLFFEKGYSQTTMREIGKACNISPGHLYYYIKSKEEFPNLFGNIRLNDIQQWEKKVRTTMPNLKSEACLRQAVREYVYSVHKRRQMMLFWYSVARYLKPEQLTGMYEVENRVITVFREIVEKGCRNGEFGAGDPFLTAFHIELVCQTWALKRYYLYKRYTIDQFADVCEQQAILMARGYPSAKRHRSPKSL